MYSFRLSIICVVEIGLSLYVSQETFNCPQNIVICLQVKKQKQKNLLADEVY